MIHKMNKLNNMLKLKHTKIYESDYKRILKFDSSVHLKSVGLFERYPLTFSEKLQFEKSVKDTYERHIYNEY